MEGPIAFEDVAVDFSLEEWVLLNPDQKALHKQVMEEMNGIVDSLGKGLQGWAYVRNIRHKSSSSSSSNITLAPIQTQVGRLPPNYPQKSRAPINDNRILIVEHPGHNKQSVK
uniref:KRAB domain-containing protein n=1 Tax=Anolis carolinensis TaxID=28377 RepID=A0A803T9R5_ANOCA